jgi:hypothetical protein
MNSDYGDTVDLDRRFLEWKRDSDSDPEVWARFRISDATFEWADLLKRRRIVVLAEGGSGKSTEFQQQARAQANRANDAWYLTVQRVAEDGIEGSLLPAERARFRDWRASNRPGWFFVDSVDEARLNHVRFEKGLDRIAEGIAGAEGRAHVIISSRHTDWESERDLARLNEALPIPLEHESPSPPSPDELLKRILHNEQPKEDDSKKKEAAWVVIMMPLDRERVRRFAEQRAIPEVDEFIRQVEEEDLWQFARRPLDLDWLVGYWRQNTRLGSLAEMLHTSLRERLREVDPQRDRLGALDTTTAMTALERIGAALVFGRATTIAIPDGQMDLDGGEGALKIQDVLPDYSGPERADLLIRPVFDPATFGRTRLHNDNLGVVRAYLAAQWLLRLSRDNLSNRELFALLFGDPYGEKVIIPSVRETAAWLSLWDRDVGREVAQREPWVLLTGGDPGSLPTETRRAVLVEFARRIVHEGFLTPVLDADSLKRFASPDLSDTVRSLWVAHPDHRELRSLLLRLILLGRIKACTGLVAELAFGTTTERRSQMLAGKALLAIADEPTKRRYAEYVLVHLSELPNVVIWDAVEGLFPTLLTPDELLAITDGTDVTDSDGGLGFEWQGPDVVKRLTSRLAVETLLRGLLAQLGGRPGSIGKLPEKREEAYGPAIGTLACNLLQLSAPDEAPPLAIEAALRLAGVQRSTMTPWKAVRELPGLLLKNSVRRRLAFWQAARRLGVHPALHRPLDETYQMQILGWSPGLTPEDLDWLLIDGPQRTDASERRLAVNAALEIAHHAASEAMVSRIRDVAMSDPEMRGAFEAATTPRTPSPEHLASEAELNEAIRRNAAAQAERDQGWIEFLAGLRADPAQLRRQLTPSEKGADGRLHALWQLLSGAARGNRYAIDSLTAIEPILGPELAEELRRALIGFWRQWTPRLASTRAPSERNQISTLDCMGITGVTLEAKADAAWASRLDSIEASKAASYATIELAGFPGWLPALARARPREVEAVLRQEVRAEISDDPSVSHYKVLQAIAYADAEVKRLMAPVLLVELKARSDVPYPALEFLLDVVGQNLPSGQHSELLGIALERFASSDSLAIVALYIGAAFSIDSDRATEALDARLDRLSPEEQKELVERVLPLLFGDRAGSDAQNPKELTFSCLVRLVKCAYATVRVSEDRQHVSGLAYSPDQRDRAEWARNTAFKTLVETPGRATYETIRMLADIPAFPIPPERLTSIALGRAAADAEHAPWQLGDAKAFEETREAAPRTTLDLQRLALSRLADFQDDFLSSDFAQGKTVKGLADENAVQGWVADRLDLKRGSSYSVERESRVVEEKEPDIRLRAKASSATLPIEVKLTDRWTLDELDDALVTQLCGKYLRAKDARHGILLIVHRKAREKGWELKGTRTYLTFEQVVAHLKNLAREISAADPTGPQPEVAVLDVSSVATESLEIDVP